MTIVEPAAAPTAQRTRLVKPVPCRRCSGNGLIEGYSHVRLGECFLCRGYGEVEGDPATLAAAKARAAAVQGIITLVIDALVEAGMPRHNAMMASYGLDHLATHSPERYEAALVSYQQGRPGLVRAVVAYTAERGYFRYGARTMTVDEVFASLAIGGRR